MCDPTVGSGAFLFAAIDVLEPMYTTLVDRAVEIETRGGGTASFLSEARQHRGERYWLLKTICLHNLFGVDLMPEAAEIAKLRLFLKLVAQIGDISEVEPLPDLDFNIKAGNLLVGLANTSRRRPDHRRRPPFPGDHQSNCRGQACRGGLSRLHLCAGDSWPRLARRGCPPAVGRQIRGSP